MNTLQQELQQLTPEQVKQLLAASGHADLVQATASAPDQEAGDPQTQAKQCEAKRKEGNDFFRAHEFQRAVDAYSACVELDPSDATCLSNRAASHLKMKNYDQAIADCTTALALTPSIKPLMRRATAQLALGRIEQAAQDFVSALEFEPHNKECVAKLKSILDRGSSAPEQPGALSSLYVAQVALTLAVRDGWKPIALKGNPAPPGLNGHCLFKDASGQIYLFGGRSVRDQQCELYALDESDYSWTVVSTRGTMPSSRAWHSVCSIGTDDALCVYGGVSSRGEDKQVHLLVPGSTRHHVAQWITPAVSEQDRVIPLPRSGHATVAIGSSSGGKSVYVFGGRTKQGVSNELLVLRQTDADLPTVAWHEITASDSNSWPAGRDGHSMCLLQESGQSQKLLVFGGNGQRNEEKMNDVWIFDLDSETWSQLICSGTVPPPRSYHTAHVIGHLVIVVGGRMQDTEDAQVYVLDIVERQWFVAAIPSKHQLTPRAWHASVLTKTSQLFLLGGGTFQGPLRDAAVLDLSSFADRIRSQTA